MSGYLVVLNWLQDVRVCMVHLAFNSVSWDQLPLPLHNLWTFRHLQLHPNTMTNIPLRIRSFIALSIFVFLITMRCWSGFSWHIQTRMLNAEIYCAFNMCCLLIGSICCELYLAWRSGSEFLCTFFPPAPLTSGPLFSSESSVCKTSC